MICFWVTSNIMLRCYHASQCSNTGLYNYIYKQLERTHTTPHTKGTSLVSYKDVYVPFQRSGTGLYHSSLWMDPLFLFDHLSCQFILRFSCKQK